MADDLKPCPFCGGDAELDTQRAYRELVSGKIAHSVAVYCRVCNADMSVDPDECFAGDASIARAEMIDAWNNRKPV